MIVLRSLTNFDGKAQDEQYEIAGWKYCGMSPDFGAKLNVSWLVFLMVSC